MDIQDKILKQIKNNKLETLDYEFMIAQVCVLNNKPFSEMKILVDNLIADGLIQVNLPVEDDEQEERVVKSPYSSNYEKFYKDKNTKDSDLVQEAYSMLEKKKGRTKKSIIRVEGKIQSTSKGYAFLLPYDATIEDIFIAERDLKGAMNNDSVIVEAMSVGGRRKEGKVIQILERSNEKIVGKINITKKGAYVMPDDVKVGKDIYVPLNKTLNANNGDKVVVKIEKYYNNLKCPDGVVIEVLGAPNKIETEVMAVIRSYDLYEQFPRNVLEFAEQVPQVLDTKKYASNRLDFTKHICFTIDGEDARDLDDAISLEVNEKGNRVLGVHIADVGEYVKMNSVIDKEAFKRGTSVYFPNIVLPMLPRELSNGICSLNERVDRLALSVFVEYDNNANVVDFKVKETIINSNKRFTYTEVQKIIDGDEETIKRNGGLSKIILDMNELAVQLDKKRTVRGCIEFNIPEVKVTLNELGDVLNVEKREQDSSHKLIECFMVAANEVIAEYFCRNKIPFVYRIHENPDEEKINKFLSLVHGLGIETNIANDNVTPLDILKILKQAKDQPYEFVVNRVCLRSMKKAKYSPECLGHFGLGSEFYCHFTSPIRRYPDLTIHRIIKDHLHGKLSDSLLTETKHFVVASSLNSTEREIIADKAERDVDDLYKTFYMQFHLGEEFEGIINSVTKFGIYVMLENTVEGLVKLEDLPADSYNFEDDFYKITGNHNEFSIGKKVKVKVVRADILSKQVDFILA